MSKLSSICYTIVVIALCISLYTNHETNERLDSAKEAIGHYEEAVNSCIESNDAWKQAYNECIEQRDKMLPVYSIWLTLMDRK